MSTRVDMGGFTLDVGEALRQLKHDMKDDWYPDPLNHEDVLTPAHITERLTSSFELNHGQFMPEKRLELNIPKRGFVLRYSLEMGTLDRLYYQALVGYLVPYYDPLLSNHVLNHRHANTGARSGRYLFKHPIEQWKHFQNYVREEALTRPCVLITDVQNYYENITVENVISVLESNVCNLTASATEKASVRRIIEELNRCLREWCYRPTHGLPQNRDASSFLANLVMLPVDKAMLELGYPYYRYMDDIRIATTTRYEARAALQHLISELRKIGLNVNGQKTKIWEPADSHYDEALGKDDAILAQIDNMWKSRSLPVIRRSFKPLHELTRRMIEGGDTQDRSFRFCMKRFENLALCDDLSVPKEFFDPLTDLCISELDPQPYSSDQLVRYLKAVPLSDEQLARVASFLRDDSRAIYDWQNYLLWQLMILKKFKDEELIAEARKRVQGDGKEADRAGAALYLGAVGGSVERAAVVSSFRTFKSHIAQRSALIAIHEVDYKDGIKEHVTDHVLPSQRGTYMAVRKGFRSVYAKPLPRMSALDIYDEMSDYD